MTIYLGVNLFTHLDADRSGTEALFGPAAPAWPLDLRPPRRGDRDA